MTTAMIGKLVGGSVERVEDGRILIGRGRYVDDVVLPGMLHAAFVRSPLAHARIVLRGRRRRARPSGCGRGLHSRGPRGPRKATRLRFSDRRAIARQPTRRSPATRFGSSETRLCSWSRKAVM